MFCNQSGQTACTSSGLHGKSHGVTGNQSMLDRGAFFFPGTLYEFDRRGFRSSESNGLILWGLIAGRSVPVRDRAATTRG